METENQHSATDKHASQLSFFTPTQWFSMFTDVIDSGLISRMSKECKATAAVMLSIKRHEFEHLFKGKDGSPIKKGMIPSVKILAKDSGFGTESVRKALGILEREGLIEEDEATKGVKNTGRQRLYRYKERLSVYAGDDTQQAKGLREGRETIGQVFMNYHPKQMNQMVEHITNEIKRMNEHGLAPFNTPNITFVINQNYFNQNIESGGHGEQNPNINQNHLAPITAEEADRLRSENWSLREAGELDWEELRKRETELQLREKRSGVKPKKGKK